MAVLMGVAPRGLVAHQPAHVEEVGERLHPARGERLKDVQALLARGADANAKDRKGSLPLHAAADGGHLELARLLLPRTQEPQAKNAAGKSALDYARVNGYAQLEKLLERPD